LNAVLKIQIVVPKTNKKRKVICCNFHRQTADNLPFSGSLRSQIPRLSGLRRDILVSRKATACAMPL
jgi:hypothetical protein